MWLILVDTVAVAIAFASIFTLTVPFALCADVVAEHGAEDEIFFRCEFVQRTRNDESDRLQALTSSEVNILILSSCWL